MQSRVQKRPGSITWISQIFDKTFFNGYSLLATIHFKRPFLLKYYAQEAKIMKVYFLMRCSKFFAAATEKVPY